MRPTLRQTVLPMLCVAAAALSVLLPTSAKSQAFYDAYADSFINNDTPTNSALSISAFTYGQDSFFLTLDNSIGFTQGFPYSSDPSDPASGVYAGSVAEAFGISFPNGYSYSENIAYLTGLAFTNSGDTDINISTDFDLYNYVEAFAESNLFNFNDNAFALSYSALYIWDGLSDPQLLLENQVNTTAFQEDLVYDNEIPGSLTFTLPAHTTIYAGVFNDVLGYASSVPEPGSLAVLFSGGIFGAGLLLRRRRS